MEPTGVEREVRRIITTISGIPGDANADADLYRDLGMASVHALVLLEELELHFALSIPDEQFVESTSIRKLTATLENLLKSHV